MITDKQFTFGFELEGIFSNGLIEELYDDSSLDFCAKDDGSVSVSNTKGLDLAYDSEGELVREVNLGIFKSLEGLLAYLKMFENGENYQSNDSCGLHIHIKPKSDELRAKIFDRKFIVKLERYAELLCPETRARIVDEQKSYYCKCHYSARGLLQDYRNRTKYLFLRNHPSGTLEFRFFSACEHKLLNVKRFFDYFFEELNKMPEAVSHHFRLNQFVELPVANYTHRVAPEKNEHSFTNEVRTKIKLNICV